MTDNTEPIIDELIAKIKSPNRMILRDDPIGAIWEKDEDGKKTLKRLYAEGDNYWAITTEELALISDQVAKARIETVDYYAWRFDCNTVVSELYGWRDTLERAKEQTLRHFDATLNGVKNK